MRNSCTGKSVRSGFTLVELLVVITIIALLAVMILPSVQHAMELARRAKCKSNAKNIAEACVIYMNTERLHRKSTLGQGLPRKGSGPTASNWSNGSLGNAASLWMLIDLKLIGRDSFLCPSAEINRNFREPDANDRYFTDMTLSYSYLSQVVFDDTTSTAVSNGMTNVQITSNMNPGLKAAELAIVADSNPRTGIGQGYSSSSSSSTTQNSRNHAGAGQNVAFMGGNADWFTTPEIPGTNPLENGVVDDIYGPAGSASGSQAKRRSINDAFLVP